VEFPSFSLAGKVALVTGGSGGLGLAGALALANAGADIAVAARRAEKCEDVAETVRAMGRHAVAVTVDVTDKSSVVAMVERVLRDFGRIDILFNNAGVTAPKSIAAVDEAEWHRVMDVSATGTFLCSQAVAPRMIAAGGGRIINMGSILSGLGMANRAPYCAAKAAVANLTRAMAAELGRHGVTVNAIAPTVIVTDLNRELIKTQPELYRAVLDRIPIGRLGEPDDILGALVFLASPAAAYVNGLILHIDGGYTAT
jgi:2-deoxy-D-gluconate 3-dehydrogenase